jgi:SAM-dependent methyltransferase
MNDLKENILDKLPQLTPIIAKIPKFEMNIFWVASVSGLSILVVRHVFGEYITARLLKYIMNIIHGHTDLKATKKQLFQQGFAQLETDNKKQSKPLDILEIGVGTGLNFEHYPKDSKLTLLDKTDAFLPILNQFISDSNRTDLKISQLVINSVENMKSIETSSMDVVVHTFVLCSVDDEAKALEEMSRVLKPGGVAIFMEHSKDKKNLSRKILQKFMYPSLASAGCHIKDIPTIITKNHKYDSILIRDSMFDFKFPFNIVNFINPVIHGYGFKKVEF